jgi:hypothetical protein
MWIRENCRIPNETNVPEKNATKSTKTKVSLEMVEKGAVKGLKSQIIEMTLGRGRAPQTQQESLPKIQTIAEGFKGEGECS